MYSVTEGQMPSPTTWAFEFQLTKPAVIEESQSLIIPNHSAIVGGLPGMVNKACPNFYLTDY